MSTAHDSGSEQQDREWEAQERALREERLRIQPHGGDARVNEYRLLVRALRNPPLDQIPDDFAGQTATRVEGSGVESERLEVWLQGALFVLLLAVGAWAMAEFGRQCCQTLALGMPESPVSPIVSWSAAIGGCLALSSLFAHWRQRLGQ